MHIAKINAMAYSARITKSVPAPMAVVGVPARVIRQRHED